MKTLSIHSLRNVLAVVIITGIGYMAYLANPSSVAAPKAEAGAGENVSGYVWSENVGWISLNSTTDGSAVSYGVNVSPVTGTGAFSGNAWNENIGWISFDRTATNNPPSAPFNGGSGPIAQVDWSTGVVTGWARALSACKNDLVDASGNCTGSGAGNAAGGWDGWIKLSGTWANGVIVNTSSGLFSGYAWGSDVVGWIDFAPTVGGLPIPNPAIVTGLVCTSSNPSVIWSACDATASCVSGGPVTQIGLTGVQSGACTDGSPGTLAQSCTAASTTCVAGGGVWILGDGICSTAAGETFANSPVDCKPKTKFWQF